jgi:creatinine amidohydrolase
MTTPQPDTVRWDELLPREFEQRLHELPLVYLPMGLCEPHGHVAAFGLDTHKAVYLCERSAYRYGGIVAPAQTYHIHETGYHQPWLKEVVGDVNPRMASLPPDLVIRLLVYQLRAFVNAGFRAVVVVTGHNANQPDLRLATEEFCRARPLPITVVSDRELVSGHFKGDHAGRYEVSQLMHVRPDLVRLDRIDDRYTTMLGRFAQGDDVYLATEAEGREIIEHSLHALRTIVDDSRPLPETDIPHMSLEEAEQIWHRVAARADEWCTIRE